LETLNVNGVNGGLDQSENSEEEVETANGGLESPQEIINGTASLDPSAGIDEIEENGGASSGGLEAVEEPEETVVV